MEDNLERGVRRGFIYMLLLAVVGLFLSGELLRIHLTVGHDPQHNFACRISESVDCNAVAQSRQALFLGVPVPAWAILTYLAFLFFGVFGLRSRQVPGRHAGDYALLVSVWCVIYSAYLAYVSAVELDTYCAYCAGLYGVNGGLFFASLMSSRPLLSWWHRRGLDLRWLLEDPVLFGAAAISFVVGLGLLSALYAWSSRPSFYPVAPGVEIDVSQDPMLGHFRAPVTIIEFSDYECPACRRMHGTVKEVLRKYKGSVRLFHKNFPLDSKCNPEMRWHMHPHSCEAAVAAECALKMGRYKIYAERLWQARDLTVPSLIKMAEEEGMEAEAFADCMESEEIKQALIADIEAGVELEVNATPTFIVNGYRFVGNRDLKWCCRVIEQLLAGKKPIKGVPVNVAPPG